ncbi:MAG: PAS domain S-box protein [Arcobacteraceae bacterium]|nr:PAS domain S-box protein [Arcobacteraceae bacterium]
MKQLFMTEICNINVQCIYFLLIFLIIIILLLIIYYKKNFKKIFTKNTKEIESLIQSYSKNVIASKTDTKGIITYTSEAFEKISGYTKKELLGKPHSIVRHPDMSKEDFKNMWSTIQKGHTWQGEVKNKKKNGEYYYVKATISPIFNEENEIIGYSAIREDITQHKKIEELNKQLATYKKHLEDRVKKATSHIEELIIEIEDTQKEVIFTMGAIGERRSEETGLHVKRVAEYSKLLALYYGLDEKEAEMLRQASPMHDIGKVGIADSILNKPGFFTQKEHAIMQEHTTLGYNMIKSSKRPILQTAAIVAHEHHERWDGSGYPNGLKGEGIHIYGRITAVADVFDALGSDRIYKKAWEDEKIFQLFMEEKGKQFDPVLVDIFFEHIDEFLDIRNKLQD